MIFPRAQFERFARVAMIPAKDSGWRPCWPLLGGQKIMLANIEAGLAEGVHGFVCLACRQIGPDMERARQAVAWTFNMREDQYHPAVET